MERRNDSALACTGLVKRFGDVVAVAGIDLEVRRGECFGLLGPNGAGKTTTVEILEGLLAPDAGEVRVLGERWDAGDGHALRQRLGVALQETQLADNLTVEEVVRLFRSFYSRGRGVDEVIALLELGPKRRARVGKLSGGQRQRLAIACALVGDPELLFLDEPTTGLDPAARLRLWEMIVAFRAGGGTVVLTTHYMEEAARLCDRLAILDGGAVIARGTPDELVAALGAQEIVELELADGAEPDGLDALPGVHGVRRRGSLTVLEVASARVVLPALFAALAGRELKALATHRATLDDVFVHLTGKALRDG